MEGCRRWFDYLGFDVFYRSRARSGIVLIHGYPFNSWDWAAIWDRLTTRFTVIAPDMMGMGFSAKPAYEYSVPDHADMHEALLAHLGVGAMHVLSHDVGDSVAQKLLARMEFMITGTRPRASKRSRAEWGSVQRGLHPAADSRRHRRELRWETSSVRCRAIRYHAGFSNPRSEMFGKNTKPTRRQPDLFHQIMEYNDGRSQPQGGRFVNDRYTHRWSARCARPGCRFDRRPQPT